MHPGCALHRSCLNLPAQVDLLCEIRRVLGEAPFFVPTMPRTGRPFSVRMTNCGPLGWVSDAARGYRYQATHPDNGRPWPSIPDLLLKLWEDVSGYPFPPEACLINYYASGARMGSHRDQDEEDTAAPVLSVSLGDDASFHVGGTRRTDPKERMALSSGDVFVLGGPSRFAYHGIDRVHAGTSSLLREHGFADGGRINLTLRRVTRPG